MTVAYTLRGEILTGTDEMEIGLLLDSDLHLRLSFGRAI